MTEFAEVLQRMSTAEGASDAAIGRLLDYAQRTVGAVLPPDYLELLRYTNGADGPIGEHGHLVLWAVEVLEEVNDGFAPAEWMPGFFIIGSNGGDAAYGVDTRPKDPAKMTYVETDFIGMGWDSVFWEGKGLLDLLRHLHDDG